MTRFKSRVVSKAAYAALLVFMFMFMFVGGARAGNEPCGDTAVISLSPSTPQMVLAGQTMGFYVNMTGTVSVVNMGSCSWSATGGTPTWNAAQLNHTGYTYWFYGQSCSYKAPSAAGNYELTCTFKSLNGCISTASVAILVVELDLDVDTDHDNVIDDWDDPYEYYYGGGWINHGSNEGDFERIEISYTLPLYTAGTLTLFGRVSGMDHVTLWTEDKSTRVTLPHSSSVSYNWGLEPQTITYYVEGVKESDEMRDVAFDLRFTSWNQSIDDLVTMTVVSTEPYEHVEGFWSYEESGNNVVLTVTFDGKWNVYPSGFLEEAGSVSVQFGDGSHWAEVNGVSFEGSELAIDAKNVSLTLPSEDSLNDLFPLRLCVDGEYYQLCEIDLINGPLEFDDPDVPGVPGDQTICSLVPDYDRNGTIEDADEARWNNNEIFRFWINDDNDNPDSEISGDDFPMQDEEDADYGNSTVDGMRDLVDFFPVRISLDAALCDTDTYYYYLVNDDSALNFAYTLMEGNDTSEYLTGVVAENDSTRQVFSKQSDFSTRLTYQGFLTRIKDQQQAVILLEGRCETTKPLVLEIRKKSSGQLVASTSLNLSISGVRDMFRVNNWRGGADALGTPDNYPEDVVQGNDFVFVHGYNVSEDDGIATSAEVFKRMYQSGFSGRFWSFLWYGDPDALLGSHYHNAVVEAFGVAPDFRDFLETSFSSPPDVAAHSLGNGVVGIALNDAVDDGILVRNYFALDAAMSLESFGDIRFDSYMVFPNLLKTGENDDQIPINQKCRWTDYPDETMASEWYLLFANDNDYRKELTWRDRCAGAVSRVSAAYNFYSSSEEVLRADDTLKNFWDCVSPVGEYSWQVQEWYKGVDSWCAGTAAGGSTDCAGWGFVRDPNSMNRTISNIGGKPWSILQPSSWVEQQLADPNSGYLEDLKSDPLFRQKPSILFGSNGSNYVNGTVGDYPSTYSTDLDDEYHPSWVADVRNRDWLLAKAFPARSRPMGSTPIAFAAGWVRSYNMASPVPGENGLMIHGWPRSTRYVDIDNNNFYEWRHGDYKDVAYTYVQELYKTWVRIINEEEN